MPVELTDHDQLATQLQPFFLAKLNQFTLEKALTKITLDFLIDYQRRNGQSNHDQLLTRHQQAINDLLNRYQVAIYKDQLDTFTQISRNLAAQLTKEFSDMLAMIDRAVNQTSNLQQALIFFAKTNLLIQTARTILSASDYDLQYQTLTLNSQYFVPYCQAIDTWQHQLTKLLTERS